MIGTGMKHLDIILKEMCNRVGADFEKTDFQSPEWYTQYSWTDEEQDSFREWMVEYLYNSSEARKEFFNNGYRKSKKVLRTQVSWFLFNYGWSLE